MHKYSNSPSTEQQPISIGYNLHYIVRIKIRFGMVPVLLLFLIALKLENYYDFVENGWKVATYYKCHHVALGNARLPDTWN